MSKKRKSFREELLNILKEEDIQKNICYALVKKALNGNIKAFETIRDSIR